MEIPAGVKQAVVAIWATIIISALGTVVASRFGFTPTNEAILTLVFYALFCIIPYKISNGSNAARYTYLVLCGLSILFILSGASQLSTPDLVAGLLQAPLAIFAIFRLLQTEANSWFTLKRGSTDSGQ